MYDQFDIEKYLSTIRTIAEKYANDYHDADELFSEGQLTLVEYLKKETGSNRPNLKGRLYSVIKNKIKSLASTVDTHIEYDVDVYDIRKQPNVNINLLNDALNHIKERERDVICKYYGLYSEQMTLEEIAEQYHISKSRVKDIRHSGENRMKKYLNDIGIFNYKDCEDEC